MNFYSNLTIFYETSPHFEGKWTHFVAIPAQNRYVCVVVERDHTIPRSILVDSEGSWSLGWESCTIFQSNPTIFCKASSHFGGKWTSFVAVMAQKTCVYGCRLILYQFKFNISSLLRFMNPEMGIIDEFLLQPHHFLCNKSPFWRKMNSCCGYSGSKHMYVWL